MNKKTKKKIIKSKPKKKPKANPHLHNKVSEEEFLIVLDNISKRLGHKFKFGYHSYEDMKQQAAIFALEGLEKYDNTRPLENFLWTHVRNRLFNFKRDNYQRPDKPCLSCPFYDPKFKLSSNQCEKYSKKNDCELYNNWETRNTSKKNIMKPVAIEDIKEYFIHASNGQDISDTTFNKELIEMLDSHIPAQYRETYLKFKYGDKVSKGDLNKLLKAIKEILSSNESNEQES